MSNMGKFILGVFVGLFIFSGLCLMLGPEFKNEKKYV